MEALSHDMNTSAQRIGVSRATLWRLVQEGDIRSFKIRNKRYITEVELLRYLEKQEQAELQATATR